MAMNPPVIPPTTTDVMLLETERGAAALVSCVVNFGDDDLGVSGIVEVVENDDDVLQACVVITAEVVTEVHVQSAVVDSSGIGCVVAVVAVVSGRVVVTSGHESAFSSVYNYYIKLLIMSS
jgi:hypothetical protein